VLHKPNPHDTVGLVGVLPIIAVWRATSLGLCKLFVVVSATSVCKLDEVARRVVRRIVEVSGIGRPNWLPLRCGTKQLAGGARPSIWNLPGQFGSKLSTGNSDGRDDLECGLSVER
jgi:hypothetical protein